MSLDRQRISRIWIGLRDRGILFSLITAAAFLIYLRTLAPGVLPGDSGEFQFAAWGWTLAHPTGYPLYLILGGIFQHLFPFGDPAYRLNLLSAIFAAFAVGISFRIFARVTQRLGVALIAALALAVSPTFWSQATRTEVYSLNTLLIAVLVWLALRWQAERRFRYSAAWVLVLGLALAHHRSVVLLIPGFAAFFSQALLERAQGLTWLKRRDETVDRLGQTFAFIGRSPLRRDLAYSILLLCPLLLYAYIPLRGAATPYAQLEVSPGHTIVTFQDSPAGWLSQVTGQSFESDLGFDNRSVEFLRALPTRLVAEYNPIGALLGLLGLGALVWRKNLALASLTLLGFLGTILFASVYHIGDIADYGTPALFFFALWLSAAMGAGLDALERVERGRASLLPTILLLVAAAVIPIENFSNNFVEQDKSLELNWADRWKTILRSDLPRKAILISNDRDEVTPLWYYQIVEGLRPDVLGLFPLISPDPAYENTMRLVDSLVDSGRPLLIIKPLPGLGLRYMAQPEKEELFSLTRKPMPPILPSSATLDNRLRVVGYNIGPDAVRPGATYSITLFWQPVSLLGHDYATSLQIVDDTGDKVAQGDDHIPGGDIYPPSLWGVGEILQDEFRVTLPEDLSPGLYHLMVRVYDKSTDAALGELTEIGSLEVTE